jgi:membrane-bound serine protease (ClpP class)
MNPMLLILLLLAAGVVLLVAEALLPTHGLLGLAGLLCFGVALVVVFRINQWAGLIVFIAAIVASPFIFSLSMQLWARSPVGKKLILQPLQTSHPVSSITLGQIGTAVTELRPIGECDFGDQRLEAASELGIIRAGQKVKVVALVNGRPTVRATDA